MLAGLNATPNVRIQLIIMLLGTRGLGMEAKIVVCSSGVVAVVVTTFTGGITARRHSDHGRSGLAVLAFRTVVMPSPTHFIISGIRIVRARAGAS